MTVVLDTAPLIYWTLDPEKLTGRASTTIDEANRIIVCSISIWEIGIKVQKGKLHLPLMLDAYADRLEKVSGVELIPVDTRLWLRNLSLDWSHRDPADRTIVAAAMALDAPLVSSDRVIQSFYDHTIW